MQLNVSSDAREYFAAFTEFRELVRWSPQRTIKYQGRLLFQKVIQFTPPNDRAQGRKAVARDIKNAVAPIKADAFESKHIKDLFRKRDYLGLTRVFASIGPGPLQGATITSFRPELHIEQRNNRGRVPVRRQIKFATPDVAAVTAYIRKVQDRVGMAKGGFAQAVISLGGKTANWVSKWSMIGRFVDRSDNPVTPFIEQINRSPWTRRGDEDRAISNAMESRAVQIRSDMEARIKKAAEKARISK